MFSIFPKNSTDSFFNKGWLKLQGRKSIGLYAFIESISGTNFGKSCLCVTRSKISGKKKQQKRVEYQIKNSKNKKNKSSRESFQKITGNKNIKESDRINGFEALGSQFSLISC